MSAVCASGSEKSPTVQSRVHILHYSCIHFVEAPNPPSAGERIVEVSLHAWLCLSRVLHIQKHAHKCRQVCLLLPQSHIHEHRVCLYRVKVPALLDRLRLGFADIQIEATPRRVAVMVSQLARQQKGAQNKVRGPPAKVMLTHLQNPSPKD